MKVVACLVSKADELASKEIQITLTPHTWVVLEVEKKQEDKKEK